MKSTLKAVVPANTLTIPMIFVSVFVILASITILALMVCAALSSSAFLYLSWGKNFIINCRYMFSFYWINEQMDGDGMRWALLFFGFALFIFCLIHYPLAYIIKKAFSIRIRQAEMVLLIVELAFVAVTFLANLPRLPSNY